jgi:hypothetical protein
MIGRVIIGMIIPPGILTIAVTTAIPTEQMQTLTVPRRNYHLATIAFGDGGLKVTIVDMMLPILVAVSMIGRVILAVIPIPAVVLILPTQCPIKPAAGIAVTLQPLQIPPIQPSVLIRMTAMWIIAR